MTAVSQRGHVFAGAISTSAGERVPFEADLAGYAGPVFNPDGTVTNTETARGERDVSGPLSPGRRRRPPTPLGSRQLEVVGSFTLATENGDTVTGTLRTK
jgi:hypothetical protein